MEFILLLNHIIKFILLLYGDPILPRKIVQTVLDYINDFICNIFLSSLKNDVLKVLHNKIDESTLQKIETCFHEHTKVFEAVSTETKRFSILRKRGFIEFEQFPIRTKFVTKLVNNDYVLVPETCYGVFVPLRKSLKLFLEIPGILKGIMQYMKQLSEEKYIISNIIQAELWQQHYLKNFADNLVLPLFIFYDDLEVGNALGSHAGVNKFGAVYTSIACLPPKITSRLNSIIFTMLVRSDDKKDSDNEVTFKRLIHELNFLATEGIYIIVEGVKRVVRFQLTLVLGDNLGLNGLFGLVESFKASYYCRICKASYEQAQTQTVECDEMLRTSTNYEEDIRIANVQLTGIKQRCTFHDVRDFHITQNLSLDMMHDILEGVALYVLREILQTFIFINRFFTLQTLNLRIQNFEYGSIEISNKPPIIHTKTGKTTELNCKASAAEMLCFVRYLGLMIGDLVPEDDKHWLLYMYLRQIIDIVTSPRIVPVDIKILRIKIRNLNELYTKLYGPLKPKFHFLVHYPTVLQKNGPCINFWSMRYESRHTQIKANSHSSNSNKNLLVTIATKQLLQMCQLVNSLAFKNSIILGSSDKSYCKSQSHFSEDVSNLKKFKHVNIDGNLIKIGTFYVIDMHESDIEFGEIIEIVKLGVNIFLYFKVLNVITFDSHVHAYIVQYSNRKRLIRYDKMLNFPPVLYTKINDIQYIASRYGL